MECILYMTVYFVVYSAMVKERKKVSIMLLVYIGHHFKIMIKTSVIITLLGSQS